jgi:hypothetical protein
MDFGEALLVGVCVKVLRWPQGESLRNVHVQWVSGAKDGRRLDDRAVWVEMKRIVVAMQVCHLAIWEGARSFRQWASLWQPVVGLSSMPKEPTAGPGVSYVAVAASLWFAGASVG